MMKERTKACKGRSKSLSCAMVLKNFAIPVENYRKLQGNDSQQGPPRLAIMTEVIKKPHLLTARRRSVLY
jgi:hypothetical protein